MVLLLSSSGKTLYLSAESTAFLFRRLRGRLRNQQAGRETGGHTFHQPHQKVVTNVTTTPAQYKSRAKRLDLLITFNLKPTPRDTSAARINAHRNLTSAAAKPKLALPRPRSPAKSGKAQQGRDRNPKNAARTGIPVPLILVIIALLSLSHLSWFAQ